MIRTVKNSKKIIDKKSMAMKAGSRRQLERSQQEEHVGASDLFLKLVSEFIGVHAMITL